MATFFKDSQKRVRRIDNSSKNISSKDLGLDDKTSSATNAIDQAKADKLWRKSRKITVSPMIIESGLISEAELCDEKGLKDLLGYAQVFSEESYQRRKSARESGIQNDEGDKTKKMRLIAIPIRIMPVLGEASMNDVKGLKEVVDYAKVFSNESYMRRKKQL